MQLCYSTIILNIKKDEAPFSISLSFSTFNHTVSKPTHLELDNGQVQSHSTNGKITFFFSRTKQKTKKKTFKQKLLEIVFAINSIYNDNNKHVLFQKKRLIKKIHSIISFVYFVSLFRFYNNRKRVFFSLPKVYYCFGIA